MKTRFFVLTLLATLAFCFSAYAGQSMFFDANGNPITEREYKKQQESNRARQAAHLEEVRRDQMEREKAKARKRQEKWAAKEAKKKAQQAAQAEKQGAKANSGAAASSLDQIISRQNTGAGVSAPGQSALNTFDCYTYSEMYAQAEDMYVEFISGRSVIQKVLMNGVWRNVEPCGDGGFRVGQRLPHLKDIQWSHNKLNPDKKTGGHKGD